MTLDVYQGDATEPEVVEIRPRAILAWERAYPGRAASMLTDEREKLTYLYEVAWLVLGRPGDDFAVFSTNTDVMYHQEPPKAAPAGDESTETDGVPDEGPTPEAVSTAS